MRILVALVLLAALATGKELKHEDGECDGKKSRAGTGHVVSFDAPRGTWWIKSVLVHGSRYGGRYDPATTPFTVSVCGSDLKLVGATEAKYDLFKAGRFEWVEVPLAVPLKAPKKFKVVVEFRPTGTKGVYVGWSAVKTKTHSAYGVPGGRTRPFEDGKDWMIRVRLTDKKPKGAKEKAKPNYLADFEFVAKTVRDNFPAFKKKGVNWGRVCRAWRPRFKACKDDAELRRLVQQLLATLDDMHTGLIGGSSPAFHGLYGAGLWIAADRGRLLLRELMKGHKFASKLQRGAELLTIDGRAARLVHKELRARLRKWSGWSSDHFLDARLSFQFFPFEEKKTLRAGFLNPDGKLAEVELERWGPGGRGLSRVALTTPTELKGRVVSMRLGGIGYIRILGSMNEETRTEFFATFDLLKGVRGILLDCRGMGGGGDHAAWAMAGRFFTKPAGPVKPTGDWQFEGPVVMLQDEREVSSAETFTWAMTETGRVTSVGRPTGGATIIPRTFSAPSGRFKFRLGVHDRKTPIKHVQPEGIGTPPDIFIPYEPALLARCPDPILARGIALASGHQWHESPDKYLAWEKTLLESPHNPLPDFVGALVRLAGNPGLKPYQTQWKREAEAQRAWEKSGSTKAFKKKYAGTRYAAR